MEPIPMTTSTSWAAQHHPGIPAFQGTKPLTQLNTRCGLTTLVANRGANTISHSGAPIDQIVALPQRQGINVSHSTSTGSSTPEVRKRRQIWEMMRRFILKG